MVNVHDVNSLADAMLYHNLNIDYPVKSINSHEYQFRQGISLTVVSSSNLHNLTTLELSLKVMNFQTI